MQYRFQKNIESENEDSENRDKDLYIGEESAFIKYMTQLDAIPNVVENAFLRKYARRVLFSGKFKGLAFIKNPKTIRLNSLQRLNMSLEEDAGLFDLADETVFDNIDIMQTTRGTGGNLSYSLITSRKEFKDTSEREKEKGLLRGLLRRKEPQKPEEQITESY
jgi:hypothetical protein